MKNYLYLENHYIIIGSDKFQIVFDATQDNYDILIRAKFTWNAKEPSKVDSIDFLLNNLMPDTINLKINHAVWCPDHNRLELHLDNNTGTTLHSKSTIVMEESYDMKNKLQLILRIHEESGIIKDCEDYFVPLHNNIHKNKEAWAQDDKDGSILIGTGLMHPKPQP